MERSFLKRMNTKKLQSSVQGPGQVHLLMNDGHHEINADGDPDLSLHRVGAGSIVVFDPQMPFDPAEEQLDPPVNGCDGQPGNVEVVGQEHQLPGGLLVEEPHFTQQRWKILPSLGQSRFANLIAAQTGFHGHGLGTLARKSEAVFGPCDKERPGSADQIQAFEINVAAIHHIEGCGFENQFVEPENIVLAGTGDENAGRNGTSQVDLGVHLDSRLYPSKIGPREKRQRQIDGGRVECVDRVFDIEADVFPGIKRTRFGHKTFGQVFPKPPVARLVGIRKSGSGYRFSKTQMVSRTRPCVEAVGNVSQPLPPSELSKRHRY